MFVFDLCLTSKSSFSMILKDMSGWMLVDIVTDGNSGPCRAECRLLIIHVKVVFGKYDGFVISKIFQLFSITTS